LPGLVLARPIAVGRRRAGPEIDVERCPSGCGDLKAIAAIMVLSVIEKAATYLALLAGTRDRSAAMSSD
jgi:hypothetical protein